MPICPSCHGAFLEQTVDPYTFHCGDCKANYRLYKVEGHELSKICFFDLETTSLDAETGIIIGFGVLESNGTLTHVFSGNEKTIIENCVAQLSQCETVITYYGKGFDLKMLISRALKNNVDPTPLLKIKHIDLYEYTREHLLLTRNSLDNVAKFFEIPKKTELTGKDMPPLYMKAIQGDKKALKQVKEHLKDDLQAITKLYQKLKPLIQGQSDVCR